VSEEKYYLRDVLILNKQNDFFTTINDFIVVENRVSELAASCSQ